MSISNTFRKKMSNIYTYMLLKMITGKCKSPIYEDLQNQGITLHLGPNQFLIPMAKYAPGKNIFCSKYKEKNLWLPMRGEGGC